MEVSHGARGGDSQDGRAQRKELKKLHDVGGNMIDWGGACGSVQVARLRKELGFPTLQSSPLVISLYTSNLLFILPQYPAMKCN